MAKRAPKSPIPRGSLGFRAWYGNQFREDVISCEEAVARLVACCPGFDGARVACNFYYRYESGSGCGPSSETSALPALDLEESTCVRSTRCEDLRAHGVCGRAQEAVVDASYNSYGSRGPSHPRVCS